MSGIGTKRQKMVQQILTKTMIALVDPVHRGQMSRQQEWQDFVKLARDSPSLELQ
jgi:hypothetical protein